MAPRRTKTKVPESIKLGKDNAAQSSTSLVKSGMPLGRPARNITSGILLQVNSIEVSVIDYGYISHCSNRCPTTSFQTEER